MWTGRQGSDHQHHIHWLIRCTNWDDPVLFTPNLPWDAEIQPRTWRCSDTHLLTGVEFDHRRLLIRPSLLINLLCISSMNHLGNIRNRCSSWLLVLHSFGWCFIKVDFKVKDITEKINWNYLMLQFLSRCRYLQLNHNLILEQSKNFIINWTLCAQVPWQK